MIAKKEYIFEGVPVQVVRRPRMKNIRVKVVPPDGDEVLSCAPGVGNYESWRHGKDSCRAAEKGLLLMVADAFCGEKPMS